MRLPRPRAAARKHAHSRALLPAAAILVLAWVVPPLLAPTLSSLPPASSPNSALPLGSSSTFTPPLYDGLSLPDEPYRYLLPPRGETSARPTSAHLRLRAADLTVVGDVLETGERPAQARLVLEQNALVPPPGTVWLTLGIRPVLPPARPADGTIEGNVYRITVTNESGAAVPVRRGGGVHIWLRGTGAVARHVIERYTDGTWARQTTHRAGTSHVYFADVSGLGDFALVVPGGRTSSSSELSPLVLAAVGIIAVLLLGTLLLLVRLRRYSA